MQIHCLSLLGVEGAPSPFTVAFLFTLAEAPGPWHSPPSILIPLSISPSSHRTPGISMPWCPYREPWLPYFLTATSLLDFQLPFPLCFPFPTSLFPTAISSPQLSAPRLSFKVGESQESCPRHLCRTWSLQGKTHTDTHTGAPAGC